MATPEQQNQQNSGDGGINFGAKRDVDVNARDVAGRDIHNQTNITNNYLQSATDERQKLLAEAEALFAQLPTAELPPHKTPPAPPEPSTAGTPTSSAAGQSCWN